MNIADNGFLAVMRVACVCTLFVASSGMAATLEANDDFSSGNYTGGTGWTGNWIESSDGG